MQKSKGKWIVFCLVVLLVILHQDVWNWDKKEPVFGFMPVALLWHACISIGASLTWFIATKVAWPDFDEEIAASARQAQEEQGS